MKTTAIISRLVVASLLGASLAILPVSGMKIPGLGASEAMAQSSGEKKPPRRKTVRARVVSQKVGRKLGEVYELMEVKDYAGAMVELDKLLAGKIKPYDRGRVLYYRGIVYSTQGDYKNAIGAYSSLMKIKDLPTNFVDQVKYQLAQLNFAEGHYRVALKLLDEWMLYQENPSIQSYKLKGQAHYVLEEYRQALAPLETAIRLTEAANKPVRENTWNLIKSIYREMGNSAKVREILEHLILNYPPKATNWLELASVYGDLEMADKELAAIELAYIQGFLEKENHLISLAQRYMNAEAPIKASWVMGKGLDNGLVEEAEKTFDVYSQSLVQAREYRESEDPLEQAAKLSEKGDLYMRLGSVYGERDNWSGAISAFRNALRKGVKRTDTAHMQLGRAYYNADRLSDARSEFNKARKDSRSKKDAANWIKYLTSEIARRKRLKQAVR